MTMGEINVRLIIEAVVVTAAFIGVGLAGLYAYVSSQRRAPDAVAELTNSYDELARMVRALQRERERDHLAILRMQTKMELQNAYSRALADYSKMLADRLRALGEKDIPPPPNAPPEVDTDMPLSTSVDERALPVILASLFNVEELDDLSLRFGVNVENLEGTTIGRRSRSLVAYAQRRGRLNELITLVNKLRPESEL